MKSQQQNQKLALKKIKIARLSAAPGVGGQWVTGTPVCGTWPESFVNKCITRTEVNSCRCD
jgi:hypothetical protein